MDDVNSGKLKILPESYKTNLFEFLNNIRDWCVSRQLWWGHRCPAYLVYIKVFTIIIKGSLRESSNSK